MEAARAEASALRCQLEGYQARERELTAQARPPQLTSKEPVHWGCARSLQCHSCCRRLQAQQGVGHHASYPGMPATLRDSSLVPNLNLKHRSELGGRAQVAALERAKAALQAQAAELQAEAGAAGAGQAALAAELHERLLARLLAAVCGLVMCAPGQALCRSVPALLDVVLRVT